MHADLRIHLVPFEFMMMQFKGKAMAWVPKQRNRWYRYLGNVKLESKA